MTNTAVGVFRALDEPATPSAPAPGLPVPAATVTVPGALVKAPRQPRRARWPVYPGIEKRPGLALAERACGVRDSGEGRSGGNHRQVDGVVVAHQTKPVLDEHPHRDTRVRGVERNGPAD